MSARSRVLFLLCIAVLLSTIFRMLFVDKTNEVNAAISACSVSVSPNDPEASAQVVFDIAITNNDSSNNVVYFKVTRPHSGVSFVSSALYPGWYVNWDSQDSLTYTVGGVPISPGSTLTPHITTNIGDVAGASGNWSVQVSDDPGGANPVNCTGNLNFEVSGGTDQTPPVISVLSVSGITTSQATINWTTNEASSSKVEYGLETGIYSLNKTDSLLVIDHSLIVSAAIAPGTTYFYRVCSSDSAGNETCTSENNFTTATSTTTGSSTTITTITGTTATPVPVSATPSPTPIPKDTTAPRVYIDTEIDTPFVEAPEIAGKAVDNKNIIKIEFSIDGGANWLPVDKVTGIGETTATFAFIPNISEDGNYDIKVRASDMEGNVSTFASVTLVIDRLPPMLGGNLVSLGPLVLTPGKDGIITSILGLDLNFTTSAVGGPINIEIKSGDKSFPLTYFAETGLWSGRVNFDKTGEYKLIAKSEDGAENITERGINTIRVVESGFIKSEVTPKMINEGVVYVYVRDSETKFWSLWDGKAFSQDNPQSVQSDGSYQFFLPPGTYYVTIKSSGSGRMTSKIFSIDKPTPFNSKFVLKEPARFGFGFFSFPLPSIFDEKADVGIETFDIGAMQSTLVGTNIEPFVLKSTTGDFDLYGMFGKNFVLSIVNTWSPPAAEQISVLNDLHNQAVVSHVVISNQETLSKTKVFIKRAGYDIPTVADTDGILIEPLQINSVPMHLFIDRNGKIKKVVSGVLSVDEITELYVEI